MVGNSCESPLTTGTSLERISDESPTRTDSWSVHAQHVDLNHVSEPDAESDQRASAAARQSALTFGGRRGVPRREARRFLNTGFTNPDSQLTLGRSRTLRTLTKRPKPERISDESLIAPVSRSVHRNMLFAGARRHTRVPMFAVPRRSRCAPCVNHSVPFEDMHPSWDRRASINRAMRHAQCCIAT